ncbi:hypothetical protein [Oceanobacillus sp. CFH 90083]|uniref:hypothetical protein n=1 Tax=Oceanobacillus sp. CFH 90083 TaxID=2592336 RepID=UPI00128D67C7|nr:hypothetical protein [Oceanobacillus sp. CFH 90083]
MKLKFSWNKNKRKNDYSTHKKFDVNEFIFEEEIKNRMEKLLKSYRDEFEPEILEGNYTSDLGMLFSTFPLIEELKHYYNNDLCISVATSVAAARDTDFNLRTHAYYAENALFRICNAWEYLFVILNHFFQTDLIVGNDMRNLIIEAKCHNINFVETGNGYKTVIKRLPEKKIKEIEPTLKKEHKLLKISTKKKSNSFVKAMKKKYSSNTNIKALLELYFCEEVKEIIDLRNEFVHRRSLGAKFTVAPIDPLPTQGVSIQQEGWYCFKDLDIKLEKNLSAIKEAIRLMVNIIFSNEVPNHKSNEGKTFFAYKVKCNDCSKDLLINDCTVDVFKEIKESIICPYCKSNKTKIKEKLEVHDRYYYSNLQEYNEFLFEYFKINKEGNSEN